MPGCVPKTQTRELLGHARARPRRTWRKLGHQNAQAPPGGSMELTASPRRASARTVPRLSRRAGFWAVAFSFLALTAFSTAPSSLYGLYERQEHLSSLTITIVYAVYAAGIVVSLVLAGHVSDWYGRRTVLLPALALAVVAAVVFLVWRSLAGLFAA